LAQLEHLARDLQQREQNLDRRDQELTQAFDDLRRRQDDADQQRRRLDAWQARLLQRNTEWESERDRLLVEIRAREAQAESALAACSQLRRRWQVRRRQETQRLEGALALCRNLRREYASLRDACRQRELELRQQKKELAERALALEQYRQEWLGKSGDPDAAEARMERLRRRCLALTVEAEQAVASQREEVALIATQYDAQFERAHLELSQMIQKATEQEMRIAEKEQSEIEAALRNERQRHDLQTLSAQAAVYERQVRELNEEVERLAKALFDAAEAAPPALSARAA
jgi:hypothetical protein